MNISVFGLGYVGCVSLGCLAQDGHNVVGVDVNAEKIGFINHGKPTIIEKSIDKIIEEQHKIGRIKATRNYKMAVVDTDISMICVGTPSTKNGHLSLAHIHRVVEQIGQSLKEKDRFHTIVIRSTVPPGTNRKAGQIIEKISGKKTNIDFGVVSNPEFLREGSAVEDYYNPAIIVLGSDSENALKIIRELYENINGLIIETDIGVVEMIKFVSNSFHALKITFANEIGNICKKAGIDSFKVMDLFCKDDKLNISFRYLKPGFAYGGSCLPKDLKALRTLAHDYYLHTPVIESIEKSNDLQKEIAFQIIASNGKKNIGMVGLSFKPGTDDLRQSPSVELAEKLIGKGYHLKIYDEEVYHSKLTGTNEEFIEQHIPHLSELLIHDLKRIVEESDVIVISHNCDKLCDILKDYPDKIIVDLVGMSNKLSKTRYEGICW